jgi:hypothetical protein
VGAILALLCSSYWAAVWLNLGCWVAVWVFLAQGSFEGLDPDFAMMCLKALATVV